MLAEPAFIKRVLGSESLQENGLLGQWLNFKLFGITYLVGKNKVQTFFFRDHWLSEERELLTTAATKLHSAPGRPCLFIGEANLNTLKGVFP